MGKQHKHADIQIDRQWDKLNNCKIGRQTWQYRKAIWTDGQTEIQTFEETNDKKQKVRQLDRWTEDRFVDRQKLNDI